MSKLSELIEKVGDAYNGISHLNVLGIEEADFVVDLYNNLGGLDLGEDGTNYAVQYASSVDGKARIGTWIWYDGEDFDIDASFYDYPENELPDSVIEEIYKTINEIWNAKK